MPALDPIKTLSPSFDNLTQVKASPSSRFIAINPLERIFEKAESEVLFINPA